MGARSPWGATIAAGVTGVAAGVAPMSTAGGGGGGGCPHEAAAAMLSTPAPAAHIRATRDPEMVTTPTVAGGVANRGMRWRAAVPGVPERSR